MNLGLLFCQERVGQSFQCEPYGKFRVLTDRQVLDVGSLVAGEATEDQKARRFSLTFGLELLLLSQDMKQRHRYIAQLDDVTIVRGDDYAEIHYQEKDIPITRLTIGPEVATMTDEEILELHNNCLRSQAQHAAEHQHIAVEVPLNSPQIQYSALAHQWTPRGDVLRCAINDDSEHEYGVAIDIDGRELSLAEFGQLLCTYAGWGMRIEFVPEDELHRRPALQVREPEDSSSDE